MRTTGARQTNPRLTGVFYMIGMYKFSYSVMAAPCDAREETKNVFFPQKACSASARRSDQQAFQVSEGRDLYTFSGTQEERKSLKGPCSDA